eukprot:CAMPEP_0206229834 /NCGR_PEP_ID=MMETSP0047_2-20121206/9915_1 /ASSEMBLY_ACC=CAM_ASM_000192 /TAXON_ID=195065 /ORGANISM="Chroomonas mesostigmatica_cf, Strain CCMP1168" /LENGTH=110 /DNA_ID=CAMNT_0053653173 /DNA_START=165 /DNA_END=497 /DNA_ORIENTATION=-
MTRLIALLLLIVAMAAPALAFMGAAPALGLRRPVVSVSRSAPPLRMADTDENAEDACDRVIKTAPSGTTTDDDDIDEDELAQCVIQSMEERTQNIAKKDDKGKTLSDGSF